MKTNEKKYHVANLLLGVLSQTIVRILADESIKKSGIKFILADITKRNAEIMKQLDRIVEIEEVDTIISSNDFSITDIINAANKHLEEKISLPDFMKKECECPACKDKEKSKKSEPEVTVIKISGNDLSGIANLPEAVQETIKKIMESKK